MPRPSRPILTKVCPGCNNSFETKRPTQLICSRECMTGKSYEQLYGKEKAFELKKQHSNSHLGKLPLTRYVRPLVTKVCSGCGETFTTKRAEQIICKQSCRKGKTLSKAFGNDKAKQWLLKSSESHLGRVQPIEQILKAKETWKKNYTEGKYKTNSPEARKITGAKNSIHMKNRLADSVEKEKQLHNLFSKGSQRPNNFEKLCLEYLNIKYPRRFDYCGDGTLFIGGKSPDAIDEDTKTICLFNGWYWHLVRKGFEVSQESKRTVEGQEAQPFQKAGYSVIFLWEDEIKDQLKESYESMHLVS